MINIHKRYLVAILLILVFVTGCNNKTDSNDSITSIRLDCLQPIKDELCESKYFENARSIKIIEEAINNAIKMKGELNYVAEYSLTVTFANNTTKNYHLSLGSDRTMNGLLVDQSDTGQGYEISMKYANHLRDLLKK
ncbi:hypothetical protein [Paenibacillus sophorae]|uniref:YhfM-like domain-containing protein n=1 Tax=Paenibacillus sophorae TaxID=1333845 RepID=A0ABX8HAP8_9BACL|nr:hypothetical protein [Paenibacillus sophorae]QWU15315.1 hypothetical protein KP014_26105 [Paenibacillus sophorae]